MCRVTQVFCASLIVFLLSSYTTAMVPSWLSAVSFKCEGKYKTCVGTLIDKQWILTTASCFQSCNGTSLSRFKAFLNIPKKNRRRISIKSGTKVSVVDAWVHPKYNSVTFVHNLALVKLECHDLNLTIHEDFKKTNCSLSMECSTQHQSGYLHSSRDRLRFREQGWKIDLEGNLTLSRCSVGLGLDSIYYCANQPVAVSSDKMNECVQRKRIVATTSICYHNDWIVSVMQGKSTLALLYSLVNQP